MDPLTKKIYDALRKGTAHLNDIPEDRQEHALINIKTQDLVVILDALAKATGAPAQ
jgi:hypothetical protein